MSLKNNGNSNENGILFNNWSNFIGITNVLNLFIYIVIVIFILFFSTNVVNIGIGHLFALFISILFISFLVYYNNEQLLDFNKNIEFKLKSLVNNNDTYQPLYLYIDADLINLFFNIKEDISIYNYDAYINSLSSADNLLRIKYDIEKKLCKSPEPPNLLKNFGEGKYNNERDEHDIKKDFLNISDYKLKDDKICDSILVNAYENYQLAEEQLKLCMNFLHSFIITIPSNPVIHRKYQKILDRAHILLKRNLDFIKNRYNEYAKKEITFHTKFIDDYDLPKAINKHTYNNNYIKNTAISNFNYF